MIKPDGVTLRSPRLEEAEAIAGLSNRIAVAQHGRPDSSAADFRRFWSSPRFDLRLDAVVAEGPDGALTGYGDLFAEGERRERIWADLRGEPARELLHELERRAAARAEGDLAFLRVNVDAAATAARRVLEDEGYRVVRYSSRMVVALDDVIPQPHWPAGISLSTFDRERDERRVFEAQEETFGDMWEYRPQPIEEWREWMYGERHDPSLWLLAEADDGSLAGICLGRTHESADPDMGWISVLGVRRPWRRRGLALALLQHSFREFRARGRRRAGLGVDADSETGAVELYARAGMREVRRYESWERPQ